MRVTKWILASLLLAACCAAGVGCKNGPPIDWRWPLHTLESRAAWDDATGRKLQVRDGASPVFW